MNLRNLANIFKRITKSGKESRHNISRIDLFLIAALFVLVFTPLVIMLVNKISADIKLVNLYLSPRFEELFGKEKTESLLAEFNEANSGIRVRLAAKQSDKNQGGREPDIIIYDDNNTNIEGVALVSFMDVLFYNIDALAAAGFDRPPRSLGQYQTYLRTVAENGFYCDNISEPENNRPMSRKLDNFANGTAAMIVASTRSIPALREKLGDEAFSITAIPYASDGTVGRYDINLTGIYASVNEDCAYKDEANSFIEFLTEQRAVFCDIFKAVPGTVSDVIPGDYVNDDPFYSKAWDIFEYNKTEGLQN